MNESLYISPQYTKQRFLDLNLKVNSSETVWDIALEIFKDRITNRFLTQIENLSKENTRVNAFAIMALNCFLVETLYQFKNGLAKTQKTKNPNNNRSSEGYTYAVFLEEILGPNVSENLRIEFYKNIRCGILHSAQTQEKSYLCYTGQAVYKDNDGYLAVNVKEFFNLLRQYYQNYMHQLRHNTNPILRKNFIKKMNLICQRN